MGREKKRQPGEDTWCVGQGSGWQAGWSAGSAGTEVLVVLALGQDSFQTAQQSWELAGGAVGVEILDYPGRGRRTEEVKAEA